MSSNPTPGRVTTLPQRIRLVVNSVIQEVYDRDSERSMYWMSVMCELLDIAAKWEVEDRAAVERETMEWHLANRIATHLQANSVIKMEMGSLRNVAAALIAEGWNRA